MKSLVLQRYNKFSIQETEGPEVKPGWVLIKVEACGIFGSDVHGMDGSTGRRQPPDIMGHEASGIIESLGQNVQNWKNKSESTHQHSSHLRRRRPVVSAIVQQITGTDESDIEALMPKKKRKWECENLGK